MKSLLVKSGCYAFMCIILLCGSVFAQQNHQSLLTKKKRHKHDKNNYSCIQLSTSYQKNTRDKKYLAYSIKMHNKCHKTIPLRKEVKVDLNNSVLSFNIDKKIILNSFTGEGILNHAIHSASQKPGSAADNYIISIPIKSENNSSIILESGKEAQILFQAPSNSTVHNLSLKKLG